MCSYDMPAGRWDSSPDSRSIPTVDLQWWFSSTDVFCTEHQKQTEMWNADTKEVKKHLLTPMCTWYRDARWCLVLMRNGWLTPGWSTSWAAAAIRPRNTSRGVSCSASYNKVHRRIRKDIRLICSISTMCFNSCLGQGQREGRSLLPGPGKY